MSLGRRRAPRHPFPSPLLPQRPHAQHTRPPAVKAESSGPPEEPCGGHRLHPPTLAQPPRIFQVSESGVTANGTSWQLKPSDSVSSQSPDPAPCSWTQSQPRAPAKATVHAWSLSLVFLSCVPGLSGPESQLLRPESGLPLRPASAEGPCPGFRHLGSPIAAPQAPSRFGPLNNTGRNHFPCMAHSSLCVWQALHSPWASVSRTANRGDSLRALNVRCALSDCFPLLRLLQASLLVLLGCCPL